MSVPASDGRPLRIVDTDQCSDPAGGWEPPVPLGALHAPPPFPVDALPGWVADQVAAVAEATQTPPDLAGCLALAALSTAAGGRAVVHVRPGWVEPVNIYTVVVLPPASRKTPVFRAMLTVPLRRAERELLELARPGIEHARMTRKTAEATQDTAERNATRAAGADRDTALADAVNAALAVAEIEVPAEPRLIADDVTPEETASLLAHQGGRLAVLSAEGGIFATLAGRYSGTPNLDVFLKGHGGDMLRIDRKGRPTELVDHPALTVGLAVQPAIIDELSRTSLFRGTGLLARILYSLPASTVGHRRVAADPVPPPITDAYDQRLRQLVHTLADWTDPAVLAFTPDANTLMINLETEIEPKLHPITGAWAHIGDWAGKHAGHTARIAGLLHTATHPQPWEHPLTATTFTAAWELGDYYAAHALATFDRIGTDPTLDDARHLLAWIERTKPTTFTRRELFTAARHSRFRTVTDIDPALDLLEQHGHIAQAPTPDHPGRGRKPSPTYWTHPTYRRETP